MRFKDFFNVMEKTSIVIFDENYYVLASLTIDNHSVNEYVKECNKARELARSDEYIVTEVAMVSKYIENPFISVIIKKDD